MISSLYAALLALLLVGLSFRVIRLRGSKQISLGDGGEEDLQRAIRAQGNATEYIPISLILLILLELNNANIVLIHCAGLTILVGRVLHASGLLTKTMQLRVLGMVLTFLAIAGLALANLVQLFRMV